MYLSIQEIHFRQNQIQASAESLLNTKALVGKPRAKQWRFFRHIVHRLFDLKHSSSFDQITSVQAAQLKFEVEDSLRRFYLRPGRPVHFVFGLVHRSKIGDYISDDPQKYPALAGYCLLVCEMGDELDAKSCSPVDRKSYLERVIAEAVDAEFQAYQTLPGVNPSPLYSWFYPDSPAIKEILNLLYRHQKKGWVISNDMNPSTKRLLKIKVKTIARDEAVISTMEYWYLRWWDLNKTSYTYPYRETNRQIYILKKKSGKWKVFENQRPAPRTSVPHRRMNRRKKNEVK